MLTLRCFGGVTVTDSAEVEVTLRSRKHLGLLLYLVAHARSCHARRDLADLLWGGGGARERHSLSQALYDIRSRVGEVVEVSTNDVRLRPGRVFFEGTEFERAVDAGDHECAVELYRGDFATNLVDVGAEWFDRWLDSEVERYRVLAALALRDAQRAAEARADWDGMCLAALRLVRANEFDEDAHCALMRGLWMKGDPASALRHHRHLLERGVAEEWSEVGRLAARIEASAGAREVLSIPRAPADLVGRDDPFSELFRWLGGLRPLRRLPSAYRPVAAVTGEPGVGVTSFLVEFARLAEVWGWSVQWVGPWVVEHTFSTRLGHAQREAGDARQLTLIDAPDGPLPEQLDALVRTDRGPAIMAVRDADAADAARATGRIELVVHLGRLKAEELSSVLLRRFRNAPETARLASAHLSGGNPALAIDLCAAWRDIGRWPASVTSVHRWGRMGLEHSSRLRARIDGWIASLEPPELEAARLISLLTPSARRVATRLFENPARQQGLAALRRRHWLAPVDDGLSLAHPLVAIALTRHTTPAQRAESHAAAARMLEEGAPVERYAAAVEYAAAGRRERALSLAKDTAEQALAEGDAALASEAARLAAHTATAKEDRFTLGWLEARAYLAGGRVAQAVDLLHLLDGTAPSHSDRLATGLALAHCYAQRGLLTEARSTLARIGRDLNPDDHIVRLQLAVQLAHNTLLHPGTDCSRSERTQVKLEAALSEAAVHADCFPVIWVDCFRTLLAARATEFSARSARDTLARFSSVLIRLDNPAQSYHQLALAALELRAGNLRVAQSILDRFSPSSGASNRLHILALHNLGVVALESGRFAAALKLFESCRAHDEQHGISPSERSATLINEAQCHLYLGNDRAANELCHAVRSSIDGSCSPQSNAQAIAIQSIVCSRRGQRSEARDLVNELQHIPSRCFAGDDGYLTAWAVLDLVGSDRDTVATVFDEADRLETIHPIGAAKLRIIAGRHQPDRRHETAVALASRTLRGAGMGWFERTVFNWDCSRQPG